MYSRRDFGKFALAGLPLSMTASARLARAAESAPTTGGVRIGVATFSFRDLPRVTGQDDVDGVIQALKFTGATEIELSSTDLEPAPPPLVPIQGGSVAYPAPVLPLTPQEISAMNRAARLALRRWRMSPAAIRMNPFRAKFDAAGIGLLAYRVDYDEQVTDEEIDVTFQQAAALGVGLIATVTTLPVAARLVPFADKYRMLVGFHNSATAKDTGAIATPEAFAKALAMSPRFRANLDIGNFTAANQEPVAFLQENHDRISHIQLKDRTRNGGANEKFGDGDSPLRAVLALLKQKQYPIPAFVEYEYIGLGTPPEEVKKCLAFVRSALA